MSDPSPSVLIADAVARLSAAGVESPRADADWLLAHALRVERGRLLLVDDVPPRAAAEFEQMLRRREAREPLQHVIGRVAFGLPDGAAVDLRVGPGVFIPRPETELLLQWAVSTAPADAVVADFCSGSGALAIGLAAARTDLRVLAVERSAAALTWLRRNIAAQPLPIAQRIVVLAADVTDPDGMRRALAEQAGPLGWPVDEPLDLVVANPPYVPTMQDGVPTRVSPEVRADPAEAVFAGPDGMAVIVPMLDVVRGLGRSGTALGVEHDDATGTAVAAALEAAGFTGITARSDLAGAPRLHTAVQG